jgi:hypothetical protein
MFSIIYYLLIGIIWTAFIEYLTSIYSNNHEIPEWTNQERVVQMTLWPLFLVVFIINLFNINK